MVSFEKQVEEFLLAFPGAKQLTEGGYQYFHMENIVLPSGCSPEKVSVLLCPHVREGYQSRLFLSQMVTGCPPGRNWSIKNTRILGLNWFAISWQTNPGLTIKEMYYTHIKAFSNE
jgi:hypothetical protein